MLFNTRFFLYFLVWVFLACGHTEGKGQFLIESGTKNIDSCQSGSSITFSFQNKITVQKDLPLKKYFSWMDSVINYHNQHSDLILNEYVLVHNNPWIIDSLANTDYYLLKEKGIVSFDPQAMIVLHKGKEIRLPDSLQIETIKRRLARTYLDLNIPEFRLRIIQNGKEIYKFKVRVGQNDKRYLAMANRIVDMRTKPGTGTIVRVNKEPAFINPKDNHRYNTTRRDDGNRTKLPGIPWLEPAINTQRLGQLIHPTTNLETLGKAYSNGCIGLREADAWRVYYFAPLGTKVVFRYDLMGMDVKGNTIMFDNIYPGFEKLNVQQDAILESLKTEDGKPIPICECMVCDE